MASITSLVPELSLTQNPPVGFYFMVTFLAAGIIPNPLDIRFQSVSGLTAEIETQVVNEGGENLFTQKLPVRVAYQDLTLTRGMVIGSALNVEFNLAMSTLRFQPGNVLVMLLNAEDIPIAGWLFQNTYPVEWSVSDLDATQNAIVIDTMKLHCGRMQSLRV